jgi:hypothetical protein
LEDRKHFFPCFVSFKAHGKITSSSCALSKAWHTSCHGSFFNFNLFKIIFKNNAPKILFADLTLLVVSARVARQDNVVAPHAAARQARHAGTIGLQSLLLPRHMHPRGNIRAMLAGVAGGSPI